MFSLLFMTLENTSNGCCHWTRYEVVAMVSVTDNCNILTTSFLICWYITQHLFPCDNTSVIAPEGTKISNAETLNFQSTLITTEAKDPAWTLFSYWLAKDRYVPVFPGNSLVSVPFVGWFLTSVLLGLIKPCIFYHFVMIHHIYISNHMF